MAERRHLESVRDEGDLEAACADSKDGQTDAVDCDRTFLDQVARLIGAGFEDVEARVALRLDRNDATDTIDVAGNEMAAKQLVERQAAFEVNAVAGLERAENSAAQALGRDVHRD